MHLAKGVALNVSVDLGRGDRSVTEQILDYPQVRAAHEEVRREGMA
jgi:hypothetical protein